MTPEPAETELDRLVALRHSMRGAEVPSVLLTWMQEVEDRLARLRPSGAVVTVTAGETPLYGYQRQEPAPENNPNALVYDDGMDTTLVLTCGCFIRQNSEGWTVSEDGAIRRCVRPAVGHWYACSRHSGVIRYSHETGDPIYDRDQRVIEVRPDPPKAKSDHVEIKAGGETISGDVLSVEVLPHMVEGGESVSLKVPDALRSMRVAVMLVKLDPPKFETVIRYEDDTDEVDAP